MKAPIVALVLSVLLTVVYASPHRSRRDAEIKQTVERFLAAKPEYANVTCYVDDAIVTLTGHVRLLTERRALEHSVKGMKQVARLEDKVILMPANVPDEKLLGAVRERLEASGFGHLTFRAHEGWVELAGSVKSQEERARVMDMIWGTPGVKEADFQKLRGRE